MKSHFFFLLLASLDRRSGICFGFKSRTVVSAKSKLEFKGNKVIEHFFDVFNKRWRSFFKDLKLLRQIFIYFLFLDSSSKRFNNINLVVNLRLFLYKWRYL